MLVIPPIFLITIVSPAPVFVIHFKEVILSVFLVFIFVVTVYIEIYFIFFHFIIDICNFICYSKFIKQKELQNKQKGVRPPK